MALAIPFCVLRIEHDLPTLVEVNKNTSFRKIIFSLFRGFGNGFASSFARNLLCSRCDVIWHQLQNASAFVLHKSVELSRMD